MPTLVNYQPDGTVQDESPPFKAFKSPGTTSNTKSTMRAWLNMIVPMRIAKPFEDGIAAAKVDK